MASWLSFGVRAIVPADLASHGKRRRVVVSWQHHEEAEVIRYWLWIFAILMACRWPVMAAAAEVRTWTDASGKHRTEAEFVSLRDGKVRLRVAESGKIIVLPLERLSEEDQALARKLGAPPPNDPQPPRVKNSGSGSTTPARPRSAPNNVINSVRGAVYRSQSEQHLRQLAVAIVNYESTRGRLPAVALKTADGKPGLSWRVAILPMLEEEGLYRQFHLNEAWDSPHNRSLATQMPEVFRSPGCDLGPEFTNYLAVVGPHTVIPSGLKGIEIRGVTDGTTQTVMLVEADDTVAVPWTKPEDYAWDPPQTTDPFVGLGNIWAGQFLVATAAGAVQFVPRSISAEDLAGLFTRDGGESVRLEQP